MILGGSRDVYGYIANIFLENCVNELLPSVKREFDIERSDLLENDYKHFFFILGYFLQYYMATNAVFFTNQGMH